MASEPTDAEIEAHADMIVDEIIGQVFNEDRRIAALILEHNRFPIEGLLDEDGHLMEGVGISEVIDHIVEFLPSYLESYPLDNAAPMGQAPQEYERQEQFCSKCLTWWVDPTKGLPDGFRWVPWDPYPIYVHDQANEKRLVLESFEAWQAGDMDYRDTDRNYFHDERNCDK